jgi:hypothetical protein
MRSRVEEVVLTFVDPTLRQIPEFLSSVVALANFMWLSFKKAAAAALAGVAQ